MLFLTGIINRARKRNYFCQPEVISIEKTDGGGIKYGPEFEKWNFLNYLILFCFVSKVFALIASYSLTANQDTISVPSDVDINTIGLGLMPRVLFK